MKILLVEDDYIVRKGIACSLEWEKYGLEICAEAANGQQGLEKAEKCRPDIVITDIRMPVMDGLALAKEIRARYPQTRIVILSGYEDFEYARQAMRLGVQEYLLKPVDADRLLEIINRLKKDIELELEKQVDNELQRELVQGNYWSIQENLVKQLFYQDEKGGEMEDILKKLSQLGICLDYPYYQVLILRLDDFRLLTRQRSIEEREGLILRVREMIKNSFFHQETITGFMDEDSWFVILRNYRESSRLYEMECVRKIQAEIADTIGFSVTVVCGRPKREIAHVRESYQEALRAMWYSTGTTSETLLIYQPSMEKEQIDFPQMRQAKRILTEALRERRPDRVMECLSDILTELKEKGGNFRQFRYACIQLAMAGIWTTEEMQLAPESIYRQDEDLARELNQHETVASLEEWIRDFYERITEALFPRQQEGNHLIVHQALSYVEKNYMKEIQVKTLAEMLDITPNYFSLIFKARMNENFTDYLNKYRIRKAMELLERSELKIYEVAERTGYHNYKYFNQIFRRHVGCTPKEFRHMPERRRELP